MLQQMLTSIKATASDLASVEVVLRCDFDDVVMIDYLSAHADARFIVGPRLSGYADLPAFANEAARLSRGELVLVVNDDAVFTTPSWDLKLLDVAAQYADGLFVLGVETANAKNFIFPCVSRRHIEVFGGIFDERLVYPDIWLRDVMSPFGRAIRVHDVVVEHQWKGRSPEQEHALWHIVHADGYEALYNRCVEEGRAKIRETLPC